MKFMMMHKVDAHVEAGGMPSAQLIQQMGALMQKLGGSGALVDGGGLQRTANRFRIRFGKGGAKVTPGPLQGEHELISGFVMVKTVTPEEAVEWGKQIGEVLGGVEVDVGPLTEAWDLGVAPPPPPGTPKRYLLLPKVSPTSKKLSALAPVIARLKSKGIYLGSATLDQGERSSRYDYRNGKRVSVIDGPFAESKELISGYVVLELPDQAAAQPWVDDFCAIIGDVQLDLRAVESFEPNPNPEF